MGTRQVIDIQSQIRNLNSDLEIDKLRELLNYNIEIKNHLSKIVKDDIILKYINEIPNFKLDDFKIGFDYMGLFISVFTSSFDSFNGNRYDFGKAKEALNEISNKYALLEKCYKTNI